MTTGRIIRRNDKWAYVISLPFDAATGKYPQKWKSGFATKKEAADALAIHILTLKEGAVAAPKQTLEQYLRLWLARAVDGQLAARTGEIYRSEVERRIIPYLGSLYLDKIAPEKIERMYEELKSQGYAAATVHRAHRVLKTALNDAVRRGLLTQNPLVRVKAPSGRIERRTPPTTEHVDKVIEALAKRPVSQLAVTLALHTGMRRGELCGLRWSDVDWQSRTLRIQRQRQRRDAEDIVAATKTLGSIRPVPFGDTVDAALKEWREKSIEQAKIRGEAWSEERYLLSHLDGSVIDPHTITADFVKAQKRLKLTPASFHDIRHLHATLLLLAGVPLKVVSERLGHASIAITANIYAHVTETLQREAVSKLEDYLNHSRKSNL